jgi:hypothetical protein
MLQIQSVTKGLVLLQEYLGFSNGESYSSHGSVGRYFWGNIRMVPGQKTMHCTIR